MDERNCGFCRPCAAGKYDECEMRREERLHSAAQDLFAALERIVEAIDDGKDITNGMAHQARKAIAKAKLA